MTAVSDSVALESEIRFEISEERERRDPTKFILTSVMALVRHCWKRKRYTSDSL